MADMKNRLVILIAGNAGHAEGNAGSARYTVCFGHEPTLERRGAAEV